MIVAHRSEEQMDEGRPFGGPRRGKLVACVSLCVQALGIDTHSNREATTSNAHDLRWIRVSRIALVSAVVMAGIIGTFSIGAFAMPSPALAWETWCYPGNNECSFAESHEYNEINGPTAWLWVNSGDNESGEGLKSYIWHYATNIGKWQVVAYAGVSIGKQAEAYTEGNYSWHSHGQITKWYAYEYHLYGHESQCVEFYYKEGYCPGIDIGGE